MVVLYARESSARQRPSLQRQIEILQQAAGQRPVAGCYTDIASGLSDRRPGLHRALRTCLTNPAVQTLCVTSRDRLARFGTHIIEDMLQSSGVQLEVLDTADNADSELVQDMLAIVTSFAGKLYGQRSARQREIRQYLASQTVTADG